MLWHPELGRAPFICVKQTSSKPRNWRVFGGSVDGRFGTITSGQQRRRSGVRLLRRSNFRKLLLARLRVNQTVVCLGIMTVLPRHYQGGAVRREPRFGPASWRSPAAPNLAYVASKVRGARHY